MSLFERLYSNETGGLQDKFVAFWKAVATRFANNTYVLGYDPINEPFPSNMYMDPSIVYEPGRFDRYTLQQMYKRIFQEAYVEAGDMSKAMYFEPSQFPDFYGMYGGIIFNVGFSELPGGADHSSMHVLNDHTYCCEVSGEMCQNGGEPPLDQAETCRDFHRRRVSTRKDDALRFNIPLIISEFGACTGSEACIMEITAVTDACDDHVVGWAYWQLKEFGDFTTTIGNGSEGFYFSNGTLQ